MRIALIADAFPPMRTSGAIQLMDLSQELLRQGHFLTVLIPSSDLDVPWLLEEVSGVQVLRLKALPTKDIGYVRRTINEFLMPFIMLRNLRKSPVAGTQWEGVVWYSPTIFLGPIALALKRSSGCKSYLVLRDIFPEWAVNTGLMGRGLPYLFFKGIEKFQYSVANVIGVQTQANVAYLDSWTVSDGRQVQVLQNWLSNSPDVGCSIVVAGSRLAGRTVFVYAGNMGVAQGMGVLLDLAERLRSRTDIGFLFVGRGSDTQRLSKDASQRGLDNVVFYDEIDPSEIPGLYAQCHIGIVALDPRHKTHNIPGKFLSYMQAGLPVLASINPGNDLEGMILREGLGRVCIDQSVGTLQRMALELVDEVSAARAAGGTAVIAERCKALSAKLFSPKTAVNQIVEALKK